MGERRVTIAVVPRERFSLARASLDNLLEHRSEDTDLIYVDGGSPPLVRQYLEQRAARHGFRLISTERYLSPNQARNLAAREVRTRYVAFVDNDVAVTAGWLEKLVECAEQTGAWAVGPVCCAPHAGHSQITCAGGTATIEESAHHRMLRVFWHHAGQPLSETALTRQSVGRLAFRAILIRMAALERMGPLDEQLLSGAQQTDFSLQIRQQGHSLYLEPRSVVSRLRPAEFEATDLDYFRLRWSDAWNRATIERFAQKWRLPADDAALQALAAGLDAHRRQTLEPYRRLLRLFGNRSAQWFERVLIAPLEQAANRRRIPSLADGAARHAA